MKKIFEEVSIELIRVADVIATSQTAGANEGEGNGDGNGF